MSLKEVKGKIRAIKKIHQVTKAMEAVSAVKMRRSQSSAIEARPFALHAIGVFRRLAQRGVVQGHPLAARRTEERQVLMVVITSDRGLAGALNTYVLKAAAAHIKAKGWTKDHVSMLCIGKKGAEHFARRGYRIVEALEHWGEGVAMDDPLDLAQRVIASFKDGTYDRVMLVYSNFESTFVQQAVVRRLLPISRHALEDVIGSIVPARGKYSEMRDLVETETKYEYSFEPDSKVVLNELLPYLFGVVLYHAILEANASEHSARMVAMKSASDRARDLTKELTLDFNRARQTMITAEVSEITSGIEAMK
jgi:F-type H+-transporting ATPase subunit gamma